MAVQVYLDSRTREGRSSEIEELPAAMQEVLDQHNLYRCLHVVPEHSCPADVRANELVCFLNCNVLVLVAFRAFSRPARPSLLASATRAYCPLSRSCALNQMYFAVAA